MAQRVEDRFLIIVAQGPEMRAAYARQFEAMRRQLGANHADPLERLLIERVVLTWARLQYVEEQVSYSYMPNISNAATAEHWDKRLTHAQGRFLKACATLAKVRQLQRRPDKPGDFPIGDAVGAMLSRALRRARGLPEE